MNEKAAYEAVGIRPDGSNFSVEILGEQTLDEAGRLARYYALHWECGVDLYRVPFVNTTSKPWAADEMELVNKFTSERSHGAHPTHAMNWIDRAFYDDEEWEQPPAHHEFKCMFCGTLDHTAEAARECPSAGRD
jgi:hypothetical protein